MKYPTWNIAGSPTPNETLYCCDGCQESAWGPAGLIGRIVCHRCPGRKGGASRMRLATKAETAEAKKALKEIIGTR